MIRLFTPEEAAYLRWSAQVNGLIQGIILVQLVFVPLLLYAVFPPSGGGKPRPYLLLSLIAVLIIGDGLALTFLRRRRKRIFEDITGGRVAIVSGPLEAKREGRIRVKGQEFPVAQVWMWEKLQKGEAVTIEYAPNSKIVFRINDHRQF